MCFKIKTSFYYSNNITTHITHMKEFYTLFYIDKSTNKLLRRYTCQPINKFFLEKEKLDQLAIVLKKFLDLDKEDILIKEYIGAVDDYR